jgi:hypothetical protein
MQRSRLVTISPTGSTTTVTPAQRVQSCRQCRTQLDQVNVEYNDIICNTFNFEIQEDPMHGDKFRKAGYTLYSHVSSSATKLRIDASASAVGGSARATPRRYAYNFRI